MIIWINGAFGAGKTQTAYELHRRIDNSYIFDPENAGYFIRKNIPPGMKKNDFQDYPLWREFNYRLLREIMEQFNGTIIVPMTIVNAQYFVEIIDRLRGEGFIIHHFTLGASSETLLKRLRSRGEGPRSWPAQQIDRCVNALSDPIFHTYLHTDTKTIDQVVEDIAANLQLTLLPDNRHIYKKKFDRIITQIKQLSYFQ